MAKIKVYNDNRHSVGVELLNGGTRNIPAGAFALLSEDDIAFIMSATTLFKDKHLTLRDENAIEELGVTKEEVTFDSDEEILNKLKKSGLPALKKYLGEITQPHLQHRVIELAKQADLAASKIKAIEEAFNIEIQF